MREPVGVVVAPNGSVYFTDEKGGALFEIRQRATPRLLTDALTRPRGLLWESPNHLLLVADALKPARGRRDGGQRAARGVLLRFDLTTRALTLLADGLKTPRGLARGSDGTLYISAEGLRRPEEQDDEDEHEVDKGDKRKDEDDVRAPVLAGTILRWSAAAGFEVVAQGFGRPDGLVARSDGTLLVAARRFRNGVRRLEGSVFTIDRTGDVGVSVSESLEDPAGLALDATGALFVSAKTHDARTRRLTGVISNGLMDRW